MTVLISAGCMNSEIKVNEKTQLIDPLHIQPYYTADITDSCLYNKRRFFDGSTELELEIEVDTPDEYLYVLHTVSLEKNETDAISTYGFESLGTNMFDDGLVRVPMDSLFTFGDRSSLELLLNELHQPVGNLFHCRVGKKVSYFLIVGLYFDDKESWEEFMMPHLMQLSIPS